MTSISTKGSLTGLYLFILTITFISFTTEILGRSTNRQAYKITLTAVNIPIKDVFKVINKQTGLTISNNYSETEFSITRTVTVNFIQTDINEVMRLLLNNNKYLNYYLLDHNIIIYKPSQTSKKIPNRLRIDSSINKSSMPGRVIDVDGNPIPGATIKIKNSNRGTISDARGEFEISTSEIGNVIVVSAIGFESNETTITKEYTIITLKTHINSLDEKVVIAYGSTTKRYNTGNIGNLKAIDIEKQPVSNVLLAVQGRVAGVFIEQSSGLPGTGVSINIQGQNSINNGNDPFYVVDGVPYISQLLQPNSPNITAGSSGISGNPLNYINPNDIESIEILKDADATAIYGSRAANGAVLITTKKGTAGSMRVDFNLQNGWGKVGHMLDVLNTKEYLEMRHEALRNDHISQPKASDYDLNGDWDTTQSKNWQQELIGGTALYRDLQLRISGGSSLTQYLISGGYHKETSVFPGDFSDTKGSIHFNINTTSENKKFKMQLSGLYMKDNNSLPQVDLTGISLQLAPVAPSPLNPDGSLNWQPNATGSTTFYNNPLTYTKKINNIKTDNLTSEALLSYNIFDWLTIKSSFGYTSLRTDELSLLPVAASYPELLLFTKPQTTFSSSLMNSWLIEPQLELKRDLLRGRLNVLFGGTIQQNNNNREEIVGSGFSDDLLMRDLKSAATIQIQQSVQNPYKYCALYGRINYNLYDKYILNLTARRDGSSRFGPQNKFHNFGAIGAAWIFSQTSFIRESFSTLSFGKLRASYGTTGSDQISEYQFLDLYQTIPVNLPYQYALGLVPIRLNTPDLQWEETKKMQAGIELGFLNNKIFLNINYNRNRSSNQLIFTELPGITGFTNIIRNFPALVENTGWEFTLNTINIKTKTFSWATNLNLTIPKNRLISFSNTTNANYVVGRSITSRSVFHLVGVNDSTGLYEFMDSKGNLSNQGTEAISVANIDPKFYGGFQNSLSYKGISLDIFFQFVKKSGQDLSYGYGSAPGIFNLGLSNQPITALDRWQKIGDKTFQQQFTTRKTSLIQRNARQSDASYTDASFIKLRNVSLSWTVPQSWRQKMHIQNLRLYAQAQNLLTITNYFGLDPESRGTGLPPLRVITFGIQLSL